MTSRLTTALCALTLAAAPAFAEKASIDLTLPLSMLSEDSHITLSCDSDDREKRDMIRTLSRRSRSSWESHDDDSRVMASRRGDRFRLRAWEGGVRKFEMKMPWEVAECIFGGRDGETLAVDIDSIQADGGLHMLLAGDRGELGVSVD